MKIAIYYTYLGMKYSLSFLFFILFAFNAQLKENAKVPLGTLVETTTAKLTTLSKTITFIGTLKPIKESHLLATKVCELQKIFVQEGALVKKDARLAALSSSSAQKSLELAIQNQKLTKINHERTQRLFEGGDVSKKALEDAEQAYVEAQIATHKAKDALDDTLYTAPFEGTVGPFPFSEGATLKAGDEITSVMDLSQFIVEFSVPAHVINQLKVGQTAYMKNSRGTLYFLTKSLDPKTHMALAKARIDQCPSCIVGSQVSIEVVSQEKEKATVIPSEAVFIKNARPHVYVVKDNKAILTAIKTGISNQKEIEVLEGLSPNTPVVLRGQNKLYNNASVRLSP